MRNLLIFCRVVLPNGERCGYVPQGESAKDKLIDLFKHERDVHLPAKVEK